MFDHLLVTAVRIDTSDDGYRVCISTDSPAEPIAEFTCFVEDLPALIDAHIVALIGGAAT